MPFNKGKSGNPEGRPKGIANKLNMQLKDKISEFLGANWQTAQEDFNNLTPFERFQVRTKLIEYVVPRMKAIEHFGEIETKLQALSEDELDEMITTILRKRNETG